jgi:hypothetical protein
MNVNIADLIHDPAWLTGAGPLVIVDRDGSLAMMAAGILSQRTERSIKVLYGGLERYWAESDLGSMIRAEPLRPAPAMPAVTGPAPSGSGPPAAPPPAAPQKPKKKSAGC